MENQVSVADERSDDVDLDKITFNDLYQDVEEQSEEVQGSDKGDDASLSDNDDESVDDEGESIEVSYQDKGEVDEELPEQEAEASLDEESSPKDTSKKPFVFDREKYIAEGITDEKSLSAIEKLERANHKSKQWVGKVGSRWGNEKKEFQEKLNAFNERINALTQNLNAVDPDELDDELRDNPREGYKKMIQVEKDREEVENLKTQKRSIEVKNFLSSHFENLDDLIPEIEKSVREDFPDLPEEALLNFRKDPFQIHSETLFYAGKAVNYKKELEKLRSELKDVKKESNGKAKKVISKFDSMSKAQPVSGVRNGSGSTKKDQFHLANLVTADAKKLQEMLDNEDFTDDVELMGSVFN